MRLEKRILVAVLSGVYTPLDLREFVQLCHDLALPIIRKKIALGKLNLPSMGLKESDAVYDCIADLFYRDDTGLFTRFQAYFEKHVGDVSSISEEELTIALRRLIFGKINNNIVRLYSEADPSLGKILRNLKIALDRSTLFEERVRFGDVCLVPRASDPLFHLPPLQFDSLRQEFSRIVRVHDNVPEMLKKLHAVLVGQEEFQRAVSVVSTGVLFKETYTLGWETDQEAIVHEEKTDSAHLVKIVEDVCLKLRTDLYPKYVEKGKCSNEVFGKYIEAVRSIPKSPLTDQEHEDSTFYQHLCGQMPGLTKEEYQRDHRTIIEYLTRVGKERLKTQLNDL